MSWRARAACRGADTALFFPHDGQQADDAKRYCDTCPVRVECLSEAAECGIWGGTSARERRMLGKPANVAKTHCVHGHPFDEQNTLVRKDGTGRKCRACHRIRLQDVS